MISITIGAFPRGDHMNTGRTLLVIVLLLATSFVGASDEMGGILLEDLEGIQLSLEGADHYYWLTPEMGRVVLNRQCVPTDQDCDHHVLVVWDENGEKVFERAPQLEIPGMSGNRLHASTLLTANRLVFSTTVKRETWTWVLGQYDINKGSLDYVVPTSPIRCFDLRSDHEGSIWCLGIDHSRRSENEDYDLVYQFDHAGNLLNSFLPRSTYPESTNPLSEIQSRSGTGGFLPGVGEVYLWLPAVGELIRFGEKGEAFDRLQLPTIEKQVHSRLTSGPDHEIYAQLVRADDPDDRRSTTQTLYQLAPDGLSWAPLHEPPVHLPKRISLEGADKTGLILLDRESFELLWYPYEQFKVSDELVASYPTSP